MSNHVNQLIILIETQFQTCPKVLRSDNGPKFLLTLFYDSIGMVHQKSCVESPHQNGMVERKHQDLLNVGRVFLYQYNLLKTFWSYVVSCAGLVINRVNTPLLNHKSPYRLIYNTLHDINQ